MLALLAREYLREYGYIKGAKKDSKKEENKKKLGVMDKLSVVFKVSRPLFCDYRFVKLDIANRDSLILLRLHKRYKTHLALFLIPLRR